MSRVVPSLDTGVCSAQTKTFNERLAAYTVSVDLSFAQSRFCGTEGIADLEMLSDCRRRAFGTSWGMLIDELQLLARGVFVLDADGVVRHAEVVGEVAEHPDYDAVITALDGLVGA